MSLVQVIVVDRKAERPQHALAADAEDNLLLDAVDLVSAVEPVGYGSVLWVVLGDVGVEKDDRDMPAERRFELVEPGPDPHRPPLYGDRDHGTDRPRMVLGLPRIRSVDLGTLGVDLLAQIAAAARERDEDHRQTQIGRRSRRVAGQNAQTAGIG